MRPCFEESSASAVSCAHSCWFDPPTPACASARARPSGQGQRRTRRIYFPSDTALARHDRRGAGRFLGAVKWSVSASAAQVPKSRKRAARGTGRFRQSPLPTPAALPAAVLSSASSPSYVCRRIVCAGGFPCAGLGPLPPAISVIINGSFGKSCPSVFSICLEDRTRYLSTTWLHSFAGTCRRDLVSVVQIVIWFTVLDLLSFFAFFTRDVRRQRDVGGVGDVSYSQVWLVRVAAGSICLAGRGERLTSSLRKGVTAVLKVFGGQVLGDETCAASARCRFL